MYVRRLLFTFLVYVSCLRLLFTFVAQDSFSFPSLFPLWKKCWQHDVSSFNFFSIVSSSSVFLFFCNTRPTTYQVIAAILVGAPLALAGMTEQQYADEYSKWCTKMNADANDLKKFANFKVAYNRVQEVNNDDSLTYTLELNKFAGMSNDEFRQQYFGMRPSDTGPRDFAQYQGNGTAPSSWDWRQKGAVTKVKNQGQCGSCWAFSAVATMEGRYNQDTGLSGSKLVEFSEQEVVDCTLKGADTCNLGGEMHDGIEEIAKNHGGKIQTEKSYPYTSGNGKSKGKCKAKDNLAIDAGITGYTQVKSGDETALMNAVFNKPVISVGIDASSYDFQLYSGGVYNEKSCQNGMDQLDHGVAVVGYGTMKKSLLYFLCVVLSQFSESNGYTVYIQYYECLCAYSV